MTTAIDRLDGSNLKRLFPSLISKECKVSYYPGWEHVLVQACTDLSKTGVELFEVSSARGRLELMPCKCMHLGFAAKERVRKIVTRVRVDTARICAVCGRSRARQALRCEKCLAKIQEPESF